MVTEFLFVRTPLSTTQSNLHTLIEESEYASLFKLAEVVERDANNIILESSANYNKITNLASFAKPKATGFMWEFKTI